MKKLLALVLAVLTLLSVASCAAVPTVEKTAQSENVNVIAGDELTDVAYKTRDQVKTTASESMYIRGGSYADHNHSSEVNSSMQLILKTMKTNNNYDRSFLVKFDLTGMDLSGMQSVYLYLECVNSGTAEVPGELGICAYAVSSDWSEDTVTYNTAPKIEDGNLAGVYTVSEAGMRGTLQIDVSDAVFEAYDNGEKEISFRIVGNKKMGGGEGKYCAVNSENPNVRPKLVAKTSLPGFPYEENILDDKAANDALWAYAQQMYDEWYARYQEILKKGDYEYEDVVTNPSDYTTQVTARKGNGSSVYVTHDTRLVSDLDGYTEHVYDVDRFGGVLSGKKQEATGYYYTTKIGDRWFVVDPLGNLVHIQGTSHFKYAYVNTAEAQKASALRVFGTYEKWAIAATRWAMEDLGFNVAHSTSAEARDIELAIPVTGSFKGVNAYANSIGATVPNGGGVPQFVSYAMPVFDPAFVDWVDESVRTAVAENAGRDDIIGYISDNEIVTADGMLAYCLNLDHTLSISPYTYACVWTWYKNITGEDAPRVQDIDMYCEKLGIDLWDLFKGFIYDRYYKVCAETLDKYDPNHMYLGNRYLCDADKWEWIMRFTGYWCDIMCINYYHVWEIEAHGDGNGAPGLDEMGKWLGIPFVVTEFYAKGNDSVDANGNPMDNNGGAGWVVETQTERGYFYQNFCLKLLQCKHNVGWFQFQFIDNDPTDPKGAAAAAQSSNKGIVDWNQDFEIYSDFTEQLAMLNKNSYALIEYFDGVEYFK